MKSSVSTFLLAGIALAVAFSATARAEGDNPMPIDSPPSASPAGKPTHGPAFVQMKSGQRSEAPASESLPEMQPFKPSGE